MALRPEGDGSSSGQVIALALRGDVGHRGALQALR